jgi:DnaK suppressor protein
MKTSSEIRKQPNLNERRAVLEAKVRELTGVFQDRSGLTIENSADMLDTTCMATDRDLLVQRMNINARVLGEVRNALATLNMGEYGVCEDCDQPISPRRLDAIPWARVCVKCQERHDSRAADGEQSFSLAA